MALIPLFVTQFKPAGTKACRLSSTKYLNVYGGNAQNADKDTLIAYEARHGKSIIQADQSGAEALIVAYMARDGRMRQLFKHGIKPHTYLAGHLFTDQFPIFKNWNMILPAMLVQQPEWPAIKDVIQSSGVPYDLGKRTCHARNYKMGWKTFQNNVLKETKGRVYLPAAECKRFLNMYDVLFPEILELHTNIEHQLAGFRMLSSLQGFKRRFEQKINDAYIREAISAVPQMTVATITNNACIATQAKIEAEGLNWNLLNQKHDSFAVEAPDDEARHCAAFMQAQLKVHLTGWDGSKFQMGSEVTCGKNWGKYHKDNNPTGQKPIDDL